jgi:hypothetical protein
MVDVYVVYNDEYPEDRDIIGIFSDMEKAKAFVQEYDNCDEEIRTCPMDTLLDDTLLTKKKWYELQNKKNNRQKVDY